MMFVRFIVLLIVLITITYAGSVFSAQSVPTVDVQKKLLNGKASLSGKWGLSWGEWISLPDIAASKADFEIVPLPNFVNSLVDENQAKKYRFGTYLLKINRLKGALEKPVIRMRNINDAWQAWWIDESGRTQFLGESGKISKNYEQQTFRFRTHILALPQNTDSGVLVIYLSAQLYEQAGMYGEFNIQEFESANREMLIDLASRVVLIAIGLLVVFQNILFYLFRRKERVLLLLGILALSVLLRATVSTDYLYYLLENPAYFNALIKLEYISIVWPAIAAVHFFSCLYPTKWSAQVVKFGYTVLVTTVILTIFASIKQVVDGLLYYQILLVIFALFTFGLVVRSIFIDIYRTRLMTISGVLLFLGVINDLIAAESSAYNFYIAEYVLFLFLFVHTQFHSLRFVSALDTAEHLTDNLQTEVAEKTKELSIRNLELEGKASDLKLQHDRIKELSETDHLTGLYNRQMFDSYLDLKLSQAVSQKSNLSLVILDIDNFKKINDSYGHPVGDKCLKAVADYLRQANLHKEGFVARYGGEEVVIILINTDISRAKEISQRLCDGLSQIKLRSGQDNIVLTASFGLAEIIYNQIGSATDLLKSADDALYQAKVLGKNQVVAAPAPPN